MAKKDIDFSEFEYKCILYALERHSDYLGERAFYGSNIDRDRLMRDRIFLDSELIPKVRAMLDSFRPTPKVKPAKFTL